MANVLIEESTMSAIGNAIREKTGKTELIIPKDMPTEIESIESGGSGDGQELLDALIDRSITEVSSNIGIIGQGAFDGCGSLAAVNIPNATTINGYAFRDCVSLTGVSFPVATKIGTYAFYSCDLLTVIDAPNVQNIGAYAFYGCEITSANFPLITSVPNNVFCFCRQLKSLNLPNVTLIDKSSFQGCNSLTEVDFPNVTKTGDYAFEGCTSLTTVNFPSLTSGGHYMLNDCSSLENVNLPVLTSLGKEFFCGCSSLTTVCLPCVETVGQYAFSGCESLIKLDLPVLTAFNSSSIFSSCEKLTMLIIRNPTTVCKLSSVSTLNPTPIASGTGYIYVPSALIEDYKAATNWSTYAAQFRALEDYTVDGTVTGELDETKI